MSQSYDSTLPTDRDWVRLTIGDRTVPGAVFEDEEIDAILGMKANKWLAAADLAEALLAKNGGVSSEAVEDLSITVGDSSTSSYRALITRLREYGCQQLLKTSGGSILRPL